MRATAEIIAELQARNQYVGTNERCDIVHVGLSVGEDGDHTPQIELLEGLPALRKIAIYHGQLSEQAFESLGTLPRLAELDVMFPFEGVWLHRLVDGVAGRWLRQFSCRQVEDATAVFTAIGRAEQLGSLSLSGMTVRRGDLEAIIGLEKLHDLSLSSCDCSDVAFDGWAGLPGLREVGFCSSRGVSDELFVNLGSLPLLREFFAESPGVTDRTCDEIRSCERLTCFCFSGCSVSNARVRALLDSGKIETCFLGNTDVDDSIVDEVVKNKQLSYLEVKGTRLSRDGLDRIARALPRCQLITNWPDLYDETKSDCGDDE